jgi:hypothetical protein
MIQVALLSRWHVHAVDYVREARKHPEIEIVLVWDEDVERGRAWAECPAPIGRSTLNVSTSGVVGCRHKGWLGWARG